MNNLEKEVINDFGNEWRAYNQSSLKKSEIEKLFVNYFQLFPFDRINKKSIGFDMGCGSGRWASFIAPKVKTLNCIEPSKKALYVAQKNLKEHKNCEFYNDEVNNCILKDNSQDFGYCLGVLHHIPDTKKGLEACVKKLKKGAPFLLYLYYRFDNKPLWFRALWKISDIFRMFISKLPFQYKLYLTKLIAISIYLPLARVSLFFEKLGFNVQNLPISSYRFSSLYTMKTDALDRFGTKLEQRFTKNEIKEMMLSAGLINIKFSEKTPYWVAVGEKK